MSYLFSSEAFPAPILDHATIGFIRTVYGIVLTLTLTTALPHARRYFISERWGGYGQAHWSVALVQNPGVFPLVMGIWFISALGLVFGWWVILAAFVNLILCHYFFIQMRWKGALRGMGAPGFVTYWLGTAVFLLEYTRQWAPDLSSLALLVLQVDFALIMLSAGTYKLLSGYRRNEGMELGLLNPEWGYWLKSWSRLSPNHWVFWTLNQLAWATEIVAALLMLFPSTRFLGGMLILVSFIFIATQIRLGFLCEMVMVCCLLFFNPGSAGGRLLSSIVPSSVADVVVFPELPMTSGNQALAVGLWVYLLLLPFAHAGLAYNFYRRTPLPAIVQRALDLYTNVFGIIIWRVFSVDIINFFIRIYEQPASGGVRRLISRWGWAGGLRYSQVAESIAVTSLFTTLKYYPSDHGMFVERLLRYARTVPHQSDARLLFEYVSIVKREGRFAFVPVMHYFVDVEKHSVVEKTVNDLVSVQAAARTSPVHEGRNPGTYAPGDH